MKEILEASHRDEEQTREQHKRPEMLRFSLTHLEREEACRLEPPLDALLKRSPWVAICDGSANHFIPHAIEFAPGMDRQKLEVRCRHWPLYRHNPERLHLRQDRLQLGSHNRRIPPPEPAEREEEFPILLPSPPGAAGYAPALARHDPDRRSNLRPRPAETNYQPERFS